MSEQEQNREESTTVPQVPEDPEFDRELERLMAAEPSDGRGKKKKKRKPWSRRRKAAVAVMLVILALIFRGVAAGGKNAVLPVSVQILEKGNVQNRLSVSGPISGTDSVDVVSGIHAEVVELLVKEGDKVEKDQLLAVVDDEELQQEAEIARNAYDLAVAEKNQRQKEAEQGYEKALQDCQTARAALERTAALVQAGSETPVNLENAQNAYADALRQVNSYTVKDGRAVAEESYDLRVQSAAYDLEKKQKDLENARIKSPISGTVVRVNTKVGQFADKPEDDKPMFIIENLDRLEMEIRISEYSIGKVKNGQAATISADILDGGTVQGRVVSISPTGEEKGNGSSERVIPATISIEDGERGLIAGITARAEIVLEEAENVLVAPAAAVLQKEDGSLYIQKTEKGTVVYVPVEIGVEGDVNVEIRPLEEAALEEGDRILSAADPSIPDGGAVAEMLPDA